MRKKNPGKPGKSNARRAAAVSVPGNLTDKEKNER
jgi:hypothetical protein